MHISLVCCTSLEKWKVHLLKIWKKMQTKMHWILHAHSLMHTLVSGTCSAIISEITDNTVHRAARKTRKAVSHDTYSCIRRHSAFRVLAWSRATIPERSCSCRRPAWSSLTSLVICLFHHSGSQPLVDAHFQSLHRSSGTRCHLTSNHSRLCPSSANV